MKGIKLWVAIMALFAGVSDFFGSIPEGNRPRTPQIRSHHSAPRHRPHIQNGKWVMKYHRSR